MGVRLIFEPKCCISKPANVVLTKGREVRDGVCEVVAEKLSIGDIRFNFLDRLAHRANTKQILKEDDFDENNEVNV